VQAIKTTKQAEIVLSVEVLLLCRLWN